MKKIIALLAASTLSSCAHHAPVAVTQDDRTPLLQALLRKPGSTAINPFEAICQGQYVDHITPEQKKLYQASMAQRDHRLWHYFWHATRNAWHEMTDDEKNFFLRIDARWSVPRLMGKPAVVPAGASLVSFDPRKNNAGEDFLYMHHQMITELQQNFRDAHLPCISAWDRVPAPDDKEWPIPGRKVDAKSPEAYAKMKEFDDNFRDASWLRGKTLGYVGYTLEIALHNNMHMRWTEDSSPLGDRPEITSTTMASLKKFDSPSYDLLSDPYAAHVNPVFWKLHGRVEAVIFDWLSANGYTEIADNCASRAGCYAWRGTWVGAAPANHAGHGGLADSKDGSRSLGAPPPRSFEDEFKSAVDDFVNGGPASDGGLRSGTPRDGSKSPGTSDEERKRRLAIVDSAMKKLDRNSPMNRGALTKSRLEKLSHSRGLGNPVDDYVSLIDAEDAR